MELECGWQEGGVLVPELLPRGLDAKAGSPAVPGAGLPEGIHQAQLCIPPSGICKRPDVLFIHQVSGTMKARLGQVSGPAGKMPTSLSRAPGLESESQLRLPNNAQPRRHVMAQAEGPCHPPVRWALNSRRPPLPAARSYLESEQADMSSLLNFLLKKGSFKPFKTSVSYPV